MCINNIRMLLNIIRLICTVDITLNIILWSLHIHEYPTIHHANRSALSGPICSVNGYSNWLFPENISIVLPRPTVFTRDSRVSLLWTLRGTKTPWVICMFVYVFVCAEWEHNSLSHRKVHCALPQLGLTFRIQIDAHWSKSCRRVAASLVATVSWRDCQANASHQDIITSWILPQTSRCTGHYGPCDHTFWRGSPPHCQLPGPHQFKKKPILWFKKHMTRIVMI